MNVKGAAHPDLTVAVLLATYNGERFLDEMIQSLRAQTHENLLIHVVDDCSTDGTYEKLESCAREDSRIRLNRNPVNLGVIPTFERLLGGVEEPFFCFADQDDVWLPKKVERQVAHVSRTGDAAVYSDATVVDEKLRVIADSIWRLSHIQPVGGANPFPLVLRNPAIGCTVLGRSVIIPDVLPFPAGIAMHDWWVITRAAVLGGVGYIRESTLLYRQHGGNTLGAVGGGAFGVAARMSTRGLPPLRYARWRTARRIVISEALLARKHDETIGRFRNLACLPWWRRWLSAFAYANLLVSEARGLGWRALAYEMAWYLMPFNRSTTRGENG